MSFLGGFLTPPPSQFHKSGDGDDNTDSVQDTHKPEDTATGERMFSYRVML